MQCWSLPLTLYLCNEPNCLSVSMASCTAASLGNLNTCAFQCSYEKSAARNAQGDDIPANELYERGELLLYKAAVLREGGKFVKALAVLDKSQVPHQIVTRTEVHCVNSLVWLRVQSFRLCKRDILLLLDPAKPALCALARNQRGLRKSVRLTVRHLMT
jgi:hypothetical protein